VHPDQEDYLYILSTSDTAIAQNKADKIDINLWVYPPRENVSATIYLVANYTDTSATTTGTTFYVRYANQTPVYSHVTTSTQNVNEQYAVSNINGRSYVWGMETASSTWGNSSKAMGITLPGTGTNGMASNLVKQGCNNWACT